MTNPLLDVTDVLDDPDFADTFDLYSYSAGSVDGISSRVAAPPRLGVSGVVQPAGAQALKLLPEGEKREGAIEIWTVTRLDSGTNTLDADEVVYPAGVGDRYKVLDVTDWSRFGTGYVRALCQIMTVNPRLVTNG